MGGDESRGTSGDVCSCRSRTLGAGWIRLIDNRNPGTTCDEEKLDQWLWKKTIAALMLLPTTAQVIAKMNTVSIARR